MKNSFLFPFLSLSLSLSRSSSSFLLLFLPLLLSFPSSSHQSATFMFPADLSAVEPAPLGAERTSGSTGSLSTRTLRRAVHRAGTRGMAGEVGGRPSRAGAESPSTPCVHPPRRRRFTFPGPYLHGLPSVRDGRPSWNAVGLSRNFSYFPSPFPISRLPRLSHLPPWLSLSVSPR